MWSAMGGSTRTTAMYRLPRTGCARRKRPACAWRMSCRRARSSTFSTPRRPAPRGEDATTVARRPLSFAASLLALPREQPRRCICVTHSGPMRALLRRYLLHDDPGEPEWVESVDLIFAGDQEVTIRYRDRQMTMTLPRVPCGRTAR